MEPDQQSRFRREIQALVDGVKDPEGFAAAVQFHEDLGEQLAQQATEMTDPGKPKASRYSWADLGRALGITRQATHERFGRRHGTS